MTQPQIAPHSRPGFARLRSAPVSGAALVAVALLLSGCNSAGRLTRNAPAWPQHDDASSFPTLASGTRIRVALGCNVSSATARPGDVWRGTVTEYVRAGGAAVIPPGSEVRGAVRAVSSAQPGQPAMLELCVRSIRVNGQDVWIAASSEPVVAGSDHERDASPTAAGFTAGSQDSQVVLFDVSVMTFTIDEAVAVR